MILFIKFDITAICKKILQQQLDNSEIDYSILSFGEVEIRETISDEKLKELKASLNNYSIEIVESQKSIMVQKIKDAILEMIFMEEKLPLKTSIYLAEKLNQTYNYLSILFSNVTYTSIEAYVMMQKTERAKQLLATNDMNVSEIASKLNYSSTAHFSTQFKNVTGLTPTQFLRIITKRRSLDNI